MYIYIQFKCVFTCICFINKWQIPCTSWVVNVKHAINYFYITFSFILMLQNRNICYHHCQLNVFEIHVQWHSCNVYLFTYVVRVHTFANSFISVWKPDQFETSWIYWNDRILLKHSMKIQYESFNVRAHASIHRSGQKYWTPLIAYIRYKK